MIQSKANLRDRTSPLWLWLACCVLSACGGDQAPAPATTPAAQSAKANNILDAKGPLANMVKAVATSSGDLPVELRFELVAKPEVGKPVELKLNLLGVMETTALQLTATADGKLTIVDGAQASFPVLKVGESLNHSLHVRSMDVGIFVVEIKLNTMVDGVARVLSYAIPVAVTPPEAASSSAAAAPSKGG